LCRVDQETTYKIEVKIEGIWNKQIKGKKGIYQGKCIKMGGGFR
jgi:hypothetical protein